MKYSVYRLMSEGFEDGTKNGGKCTERAFGKNIDGKYLAQFVNRTKIKRQIRSFKTDFMIDEFVLTQ